MTPAVPDAAARRLRLAELASGLGAGVLGLGIGILAADYLRDLGLPLLLVGLLLHAWGMADKHRLERTADEAPRLAMLVYGLCWLVLAVLAIYVAVRIR
jgi:drug/metabolite transporter (DMT)-like permease